MEKDELLSEPGCADGWSSYESEVDGECPDCGTPTVGGMAAFGCNWSSVTCNTCGYAQCDQAC